MRRQCLYFNRRFPLKNALNKIQEENNSYFATVTRDFIRTRCSTKRIIGHQLSFRISLSLERFRSKAPTRPLDSLFPAGRFLTWICTMQLRCNLCTKRGTCCRLGQNDMETLSLSWPFSINAYRNIDICLYSGKVYLTQVHYYLTSHYFISKCLFSALMALPTTPQSLVGLTIVIPEFKIWYFLKKSHMSSIRIRHSERGTHTLSIKRTMEINRSIMRCR